MMVDGALILADIEGDRKMNILGLTSQVRWEGHKELPETHAPSQYSALLPRMKSSGVEVEDLYRFLRGSSGPQVVSGEVWG